MTIDPNALNAQRGTVVNSQPIPVSETLAQICKASSDNKVRTNNTYANKTLSATAEVRSVTERMNPRYWILLRSGTVAIHAGTDNMASATKLTKGSSVRVSGVITDISTDYNGCSISLKDAMF